MPLFDNIGPEKIVEVYDVKTGMHGVAVIDNTALGPGKGGIRMTATVNTEEVAKLARIMTWKTALAELPFGGAKAGIFCDAKSISLKQKEAIIKSFARALKCVVPSQYIAAPDMNTGEKEMKWFAQGAGNLKACTGKPKSMHGIPHELGSTGFGVYHATIEALKFKGIKIKGAKIAVEGFGNVGSFAAKFLTEKGALLVGTSDSQGCIMNEDGLNFKELSAVKAKKGSVNYYQKGYTGVSGKLASIECDVLITAAVPNFINESNYRFVKAPILVEGSNIPMPISIEQKLFERGITIVPDFVANAGGVISSYIEFKDGTPKQMFKLVEEKVVRNTDLTLKLAEKQGIFQRGAAQQIAVKRVMQAMKKRKN
ncbi:MAG: Glu/Leu/Phe/Val dehydrogenase [Candidatus Diapherotrites archaeon]|nr:Glu/Leu/Phe/Val dehydrogenase [Candidatus Diapherotrites archaeon]